MSLKKILCTLLALLTLLALVACDTSNESNSATGSDSVSVSETESEVASETESQTQNDESDSVESSECLHTEVEWTITKNATCTEKGSRDAICLSCSSIVTTEEIPTVAHIEEIIPSVPASCTATGLTDGKKCSVCSTVLSEQQTIQKLNHTEKLVKGTQPTCTSAGKTDSKICSVCNEVLVAATDLAALGHSEGDWIFDLLPTTTANGSKHTECTRCHELIQTGTIPMISADHVHTGKDWIVAVPATCTEEGKSNLVCECGYVTDSKTIECIPHTESVLLKIAATCTSTGLTEGKECSVCHLVLVPQSPTAKVSHTEETVAGTAPTCTEYGSTDGKRCSVCTTVLQTQLPIPPTGHTFVNEICQGCGKAEPYGIWIVDGLGNPLSDIIIKVLKNGEQIKMYAYKGEYLSLDIDRGDYTIELDLSNLTKTYVYDESLCILTPNKKNTTIRLYEAVSDTTDIFVSPPIDKDYIAYNIGVGSSTVKLTPNDYTFFVFRPTKAAIYTFTYECKSTLAISYHGSIHFVQGSDLSEFSSETGKYDNGLSLSVYTSNIGAEYVFAIQSESATSCILNIQIAGDPGTRLEDEEWVPYLESEDTVNKQLSASKDGAYTIIDITDTSVSAVYNESDGYYHLGSRDGKVIFIDLTTDSQFVSSIQTICANQRIGTYIYDENGKVAEKRSYNELFIQYGMPTDTTPVEEPIRVPLTKKLAEAITTFGNKNGWWGDDPERNIFTSVLLGSAYNQEYAWLLYCGVYQ